MNPSTFCLIVCVTCLLAGPPLSAQEKYPVVGGIERYDDALGELLEAEAEVQRLSEDRFAWSEGPVWVPQEQFLLFSDVPRNVIWRWSGGDGLVEFVAPSAADTTGPRDPSGEGTNGLVLGAHGTILAGDHGSRTVIAIDLQTREKRVMVDSFDGKRFNSPNDLVISRLSWPGAVFFTDPPYGLTGQDQSPLKELPFNGVFRLDPSGEVHLLDDSLGRPNGVALSPDERTLYVANSQKEHAVWMAYTLDEDGNVSGPGRLFASAQRWADAGEKGLPDGLAVDRDGNLWATGPGGVYVIDPQGHILGLIRTGSAIANCTFGGPGGNTLYMTSAAFLARVKTLSTGLGFEP